MVPGRLGLIITLFLCMTNTLNSVAKSAPNSGSVSKIVSWMLACRSGHMNYSLITLSTITGILKEREFALKGNALKKLSDQTHWLSVCSFWFPGLSMPEYCCKWGLPLRRMDKWKRQQIIKLQKVKPRQKTNGLTEILTKLCFWLYLQYSSCLLLFSGW